MTNVSNGEEDSDKLSEKLCEMSGKLRNTVYDSTPENGKGTLFKYNRPHKYVLIMTIAKSSPLASVHDRVSGARSESAKLSGGDLSGRKKNGARPCGKHRSRETCPTKVPAKKFVGVEGARGEMVAIF